MTGIDDEPPVVHGTDRDTTAWHLLQGWLEDHARRRRGITVHRGAQVTGVPPGSDQEPGRVVTADAGEYQADLVIGALAGDAAHAASPMVGGGLGDSLIADHLISLDAGGPAE